MGRTITPQHEKKPQQKAEKVKGGAGDWVVMPNGKFYDPKRRKWVLRCHGCKKPFYARRVDAKTCCNTCRKRVQRRTLKQNSALAAQMKTVHEAQLLALGF